MAWSGALPNVDRLGSGAETQLSGVTLRCARRFEASRKHEGYVVVAASHGNGTAIMGTFTHQIGDRRGSDPPPSVRRLSRVSDLKHPPPSANLVRGFVNRDPGLGCFWVGADRSDLTSHPPSTVKLPRSTTRPVAAALSWGLPSNILMVPLTSCQGDLDVTLTVSPEWGSGISNWGVYLVCWPRLLVRMWVSRYIQTFEFSSPHKLGLGLIV